MMELVWAMLLFQSGVSLSICLHGYGIGTEAYGTLVVFQSGVSLSICLHHDGHEECSSSEARRSVSIRRQPEYLPSHASLQAEHDKRFRSGVSIRRQPEYLPSHRRLPLRVSVGLRSSVSIRRQPEYLPSLRT